MVLCLLVGRLPRSKHIPLYTLIAGFYLRSELRLKGPPCKKYRQSLAELIWFPENLVVVQYWEIEVSFGGRPEGVLLNIGCPFINGKAAFPF